MMGLGEGGRKRAAAMWYLVGLPSYKNLREDLEGLLARHLAGKRQEKTQEMLDEPTPAWQAARSPRLSRKVEQIQQNRREERLARYQQVIALRRQGMSQAAIARRVGMGASTVQAWLAAGEFASTQAA